MAEGQEPELALLGAERSESRKKNKLPVRGGARKLQRERRGPGNWDSLELAAAGRGLWAR